VTLRNGVLVYIEKAADSDTAQASLSLTKPRLLALVAGDTDSPGVKITGDQSALDTLTSVLTAGDPGFNIVTP
ncbi:alkyl sulfatase C-terminal domain-containing protein, partial [Microbacterium sp.]|uniref:alkyl sulfatase C-terminal domain-containing protein n=1 Tax=Microbacterium sp. TaxID=51671 RepID=UPI003567EC86